MATALRRSRHTLAVRPKRFEIPCERTVPRGRPAYAPAPLVPTPPQPLLADTQGERLRALLHQSPRAFGKTTRRWTLALLAEGCLEQGLTARTVSIESSRRALQRLGVGWNRAKHGITSPDPRYAAKKSSVID